MLDIRSKTRNEDSVAGIINVVLLGKMLPSQCLKLSPLSYFVTWDTSKVFDKGT